MQLKINSKKVHYSSLGTGRQILILPGWAHDHTVWQNIQTRLSSDFQVIVLDFPGFGESQINSDIKDLNGYAHFLNKVIRELNLENFILLGHSFGGAVAIKTLSLYPDTPVTKLILVDSAGIKRFRPKKIIGFLLAKAGKVAFSLPVLKRYSNNARTFLYKNMHETDYLDVNRLKQTFNRVVNENIEGQLDKLTKSTTIVWGQKDSITPLSIAKILHSRIKNSQLIIMKNATHFPFLDFPEQFCDEIRKITRSL